MIYRQISLARVMRLIKIKATKNLYFQDKRSKCLYRVDNEKWEVSEFHDYNFFELEVNE